MSNATGLASTSEIESIVQFMLEDPDHWLVKRHHRIHLINLIALQQQLCTLEDEFDAVVRKDNTIHRGDLEKHQSVKQQEPLLDKIQIKVKQYG